MAIVQRHNFHRLEKNLFHNPSVMCIFGNWNHNELKEIMRTREYSCQSYSDQIEQRILIEQFKRLLKLTNPTTKANFSLIWSSL